MSHRSDCPDRYEARRQGERAFENGYGIGSNPYRDRDYGESWDDRQCREAAASEWRSGHYRAELRAEEEAEERRAERRRQEARAEQEYCEAMELEAAMAEYAIRHNESD